MGAGFLPSASLTIGGILAVNVVVVGATEIHGQAPPGLTPGTLNDVSVESAAFPGRAPAVVATLSSGWLADFLDVADGDLFHADVEKIFRLGLTAGCGGGAYCRNAPVTRAQMAVFLLKAEHGSAYAPPACTGVFDDVACPGQPFADWIEQLWVEGLTTGCGGNDFCPGAAVTRQQMAVLLLKASLGPGYVPPPADGIFGQLECSLQMEQVAVVDGHGARSRRRLTSTGRGLV